MYKTTETVARIKETARKKKIKISDMLSQCELSITTLSSMKSRGSWIQANSLAKIADYLDVSVDYLLGRTDKSNITFSNVGNNNKGNQAIHGNVTVSQPQKTDNRDSQLLQIIQELSPVDYARVIMFIEEIKNKEV